VVPAGATVGFRSVYPARGATPPKAAQKRDRPAMPAIRASAMPSRNHLKLLLNPMAAAIAALTLFVRI